MDEQLRKENIVDEGGLSELIVKCKLNARDNISRLRRKQKFALWFGGTMILLLIALLWGVIPGFIEEVSIRKKLNVMCVFLFVTLVGGIWWDLKTYRWISGTKVDEMPVVQVIQRISRFRLFLKYEVIAISLWVIAFTLLYYWAMDIWKIPLSHQLIFIALLLVVDVLILFFVYKRLIMRDLNEAEKNLKELKELQTN